jgi:hypothetical protein
VNFRLAAALLLTLAISSNVCFAKETAGETEANKVGEASSASGAQTDGVAKKFRKMSFPKDNFAVLLPGDFTTVEKTDVRTYTCADYPHGLISAMCATAPEGTTFSAAVLKQLVDKLTPNKKSTDKEGPVTVNGVAGTQWDITNNVDTPQDGCQVRGFIVGRKLYILMVYGTKPWINSAAIRQFMDSLEVLGE